MFNYKNREHPKFRNFSQSLFPTSSFFLKSVFLLVFFIFDPFLFFSIYIAVVYVIVSVSLCLSFSLLLSLSNCLSHSLYFYTTITFQFPKQFFLFKALPVFLTYFAIFFLSLCLSIGCFYFSLVPLLLFSLFIYFDTNISIQFFKQLFFSLNLFFHFFPMSLSLSLCLFLSNLED